MDIKVNISIGELLDKISVLQIKKERISDEKKLHEINKELEVLTKICKENLNSYEEFLERLKKVNEVIWDMGDEIRKKAKAKEFDKEYLEVSINIHFTNDERFKIKDEINKHFGSEIKEQKSYEED
jgi:hypothetical protein